MLMSIEKEMLAKINNNDIIEKVTAQSDIYKKNNVFIMRVRICTC